MSYNEKEHRRLVIESVIKDAKALTEGFVSTDFGAIHPAIRVERMREELEGAIQKLGSLIQKGIYDFSDDVHSALSWFDADWQNVSYNDELDGVDPDGEMRLRIQMYLDAAQEAYDDEEDMKKTLLYYQKAYKGTSKKLSASAYLNFH